jgi:hypothetical protein
MSLRRLTHDEWLWYVIFPPAFVAALVLEGLIAGWDRQVFINLSPVLIAAAFFPPLAGWWVTNMNKPASARATNLSVLGLFASVVIEAMRYVLSINQGILYFVFEACTSICFVPGMLCTMYYLGVEGKANGPLMAKGQRIIVGGIFSLIYIGLGSYGVANIASGVFHADLLPQAWFWLGPIGLQGGVLLMGVGVLLTRRGWSLTMSKNQEEEKQTWGESLQALTFVLTMLGIFLSAFSFSVLGGLIAIIVGLLFYPAGWLVSVLSKPKCPQALQPK